MMDVPINYWAVFVAAVAGWFIGWLWYGPLFGKKWMKMTGITMAAAKKNLNPKVAMLLGLGTFYLVAMVLGHLVYMLGIFEWQGAKELAFWVWLGFFVPLTMGDWLWGGKPFKLFLLNAVYWIIVLDVAAYILVRWV